MMSAPTVQAPPRSTQRYQLDSGVARLTPAERAARGKTARAVTQFAAAYADQNERDHQSLVDAVSSGRIIAERDI
jgi:hypothetical protein